MAKLLNQDCEIHVEPSRVSDGQYVVFVNDPDGNFLTSQDAEHEQIAAEIKSKLTCAEEMLFALEQSVRFLADLNGSEWIKGDDAGSIDMRQRAKGLQQRAGASILGQIKGE